ncbi:unnamed protein product [Boreogadus saida]
MEEKGIVACDCLPLEPRCPATRCPLPTGHCPLPATRCLLPAACYPLPATRCLLPAACYPLPATRCLLPRQLMWKWKVISAMVEKELRKRNFDSLKYMNGDMEEKGIVARHCLPLEPRCQGTTAARHHRRKATTGKSSATAVLPRLGNSSPHGSRQQQGVTELFLLQALANPTGQQFNFPSDLLS